MNGSPLPEKENIYVNKFMRQTATWLMAALVLCLITATALAADADKSAKEQEKIAKEQAKIVKQREEIDELSAKALARRKRKSWLGLKNSDM